MEKTKIMQRMYIQLLSIVLLLVTVIGCAGGNGYNSTSKRTCEASGGTYSAESAGSPLGGGSVYRCQCPSGLLRQGDGCIQITQQMIDACNARDGVYTESGQSMQMSCEIGSHYQIYGCICKIPNGATVGTYPVN